MDRSKGRVSPRAALRSLAIPIQHLAGSILMKLYGQQEIIPLETSVPTPRTLQNVPDLFNRSAHSGSPSCQ